MELPSPSCSWLRRCLGDLLLLGVLAGLAWKVGHDVRLVRDLNLGDELAYMLDGFRIPEVGLPAAESSPLYCLWYHALSRVQPDPASLYYLNWQLLLVLLGGSVYLLARCAGGVRPIAFLAGFLAINSGLLTIWQSYTGHLAAVLLALGTAAASRCRTGAWSMAVAGLFLLAASYIRPECAVAFLLFCLAGLAGAVCVVRSRDDCRKVAGPALVLLLLVGAGLKWVGNPLGGGRSFVAFAQHYAFNRVAQRNLPLDRLKHFEAFAGEDFDGARTVATAWKANRQALLWHVGVNLRALPGALRKLTEPKLDLKPPWQRILSWGLLASLLMGLGGQLRRLILGRGLGWQATANRGLVVGLVLLGCLAVPALAACLVVSPNSHYLVPGVVLLFGLTLPGLAHWAPARAVCLRLDSARALLLLAVFFAATAPNMAHGWCVQDLGRKRQHFPLFFQRRAEAVRDLKIKGPCVALDIFRGTIVYAGLPGRWVYPDSRPGSFREFMRQAEVGLVFLDCFLLGDVLFRDDPDFQQFAAGRWEEFKYVPVPELFLRIAVRKDLLP
jgi:hypothetical protein